MQQGMKQKILLKDKIVDLNSTYACISEPLAELPGHLSNTIFWDTQDPYLYVRSTSDNRIIVGGADEPFRKCQKKGQHH